MFQYLLLITIHFSGGGRPVTVTRINWEKS